MLDLTPEQRSALAAGIVMRRWFVWGEARDPNNGNPAPAGFWDDTFAVTVGGKVYNPAPSMQISANQLRGDFTVPRLTATFSGLDGDATALVRGTSLAQAPILVSLGLFDPVSRSLYPPLIPRFRGFIEETPIKTPEAGGQSTMAIICQSISRALTRPFTGTRSPASCEKRDPTDAFYKWTAAQRKPIYFGQKAPKS